VQRLVGGSQFGVPMRDLCSMCSEINRHAVQFHARDRRDDRIGHLLALLIDVVKQLVLLGIPEEARQHGIQGGVFELFGCERVGGPIGGAKFLRYIETIVDIDGPSRG
jgi:hypothetical protein